MAALADMHTASALITEANIVRWKGFKVAREHTEALTCLDLLHD